MYRKPGYRMLLSLLLLIISMPVAIAQGKKEITGKVMDAHQKAPLGFASVSALSPVDSTLLVGGYTQDNGKFTLDVHSGDSVLIRISYLGYQTQILPVHFPKGHTKLSMESISLLPLANTLQTVTVAAEKEKMYEFKKDSVVFNVPEDFMTGGTAMDVLEYTPTLTFDANNNIMVKGQGNVKVYVDSKPIALTGMDVQTYLNNTPSFMIEKIEILKTPPYPEDAAEALAEGITDRYYVNILTRKIRYRGYSTALTGGLNSRKELMGRIRFNMNLNPFQLNYYNNLRYNTDSGYTHRTSYLDNNDSSVLDQRNYSTNESFNQYLNAQYEFKFSDKEKLRLNAKAGWNQGKNTSRNVSTIDNPKTIPDQDRVQENESHSNGYNISSGADYRKDYDKEGKELHATFDFSGSNRQNNRTSLGKYLIKNDTLNQLNEGNSHQMNLRGNIQYKNTYGNEKFYLLNGAMSFSNHHNLNDVRRSDTASHSSTLERSDRLSTNYFSGSSHYSLLALLGKRDKKLGWVAAASLAYYIQNGSDHYQLSAFDNHAFISHNAIGMNYSPGKDQQLNINFNPGFESYTQETRANDTVPVMTYRYTNFIPGASVKYSYGDHELTLSYHRDVDRPEWNQLNPYIDNSDPLNIREGNPELRPTFTNKYHLRYEYNHQAVYAAFDLEKDIAKDVISGYTTVDSNGVSTRTYVNLNDRKRDNAGLDVGTHYFKDIPALKGNININAEAGLDAYRLQSDDEHVSKDFQNVSGFSSHFKLWSAIRVGIFSLMVNGRYEGPRYFAQGKRPSRFSSGLRARANLLNHRLNFTLGIENLFGASVKDAYYKTANYVQYSSNRHNVRYFSLYITYKFRKYNKLGKEGDNS